MCLTCFGVRLKGLEGWFHSNGCLWDKNTWTLWQKVRSSNLPGKPASVFVIRDAKRSSFSFVSSDEEKTEHHIISVSILWSVYVLRGKHLLLDCQMSKQWEHAKSTTRSQKFNTRCITDVSSWLVWATYCTQTTGAVTLQCERFFQPRRGKVLVCWGHSIGHDSCHSGLKNLMGWVLAHFANTAFSVMKRCPP